MVCRHGHLAAAPTVSGLRLATQVSMGGTDEASAGNPTQLYAGVDGFGIRPEKPLKHLIREQPTPTREANDFLGLVE